VKAKPWEKPAGDKGTGNADNNVADDAKAGAAHDLSGQPARDEADEQNNDQTLTRYVHEQSPGCRAAFLPRWSETYPLLADLTTPI
jgi:hypothetical protein